MKDFRPHAITACVVAMAVAGCGREQPAAPGTASVAAADLGVYADRFLNPGLVGEFTARPGTAYVRADGMNSKRGKFANFYHFSACGDHLVLVSIAENPQ